VLARENAETGSRIVLDLRVPDPCSEDQTLELVSRLEAVSEVAPTPQAVPAV